MASNLRQADLERATARILASGAAITAIWKSLVEEETGLQDNELFAELCERSVIAYAGFLRGDDCSEASLARLWNSIQPSRGMAGDSVVAMSLFVEALRLNFQQTPDLPVPLDDILRQAIRFVRLITNSILESIDAQPGDDRWQKIAEELERQRRQRQARLNVLTDISRAVNTSSNLPELVTEVHRICSRVIDTDHFVISSYDGKSGNMVPHLVYYGEQMRCTSVTSSGRLEEQFTPGRYR